MCNGIEFHTAGAHTLKARLPIEVLVRGRVRRHLSDDFSKRGEAYGVKRDLRFAGWLSNKSLKVSEEILNFMRDLTTQPLACLIIMLHSMEQQLYHMNN